MQQQFDEGVDSWKSVMFLYNSALKEVSTKLEILNDEFQYVHQYNPCLLYTSGAKAAWLKIQEIDESACIHRLMALEGAIRGVKKTMLP